MVPALKDRGSWESRKQAKGVGNWGERSVGCVHAFVIASKLFAHKGLPPGRVRENCGVISRCFSTLEITRRVRVAAKHNDQHPETRNGCRVFSFWRAVGSPWCSGPLRNSPRPDFAAKSKVQGRELSEKDWRIPLLFSTLDTRPSTQSASHDLK